MPCAPQPAPDSRPPAGDIQVAVATTVDDELVAAFARLIPQLSRSAALPTAEVIRGIVEAEATTVLIARDLRAGGRIVGTLTLAVFTIPTGMRAWIEDVVVDDVARGRGAGEALTRTAVDLARQRGARTVDLTSNRSRQAAHRLYEKTGFHVRDTSVYRFGPKPLQ